MSNPFDMNDGDTIMQLSDNLGIDSDGNMMMRLSDSLSMDMDTGDLHITSTWDSEDD